MSNSLEGKKVLVIDDDIALCQMMEIAFTGVGAEVTMAYSGRAGLHQFFSQRPDLVLLDVVMPDLDGWETCRQIRLYSDVPIIMLTSLNKDELIIRALDQGADDFVIKPFNTDVLLARARAAIRRAPATDDVDQGPTYTDRYLTVDLTGRRVLVRGEPVRLTATEFRLLAYLLKRAGHVVTYEQILQHVWGWEYRESVDYVHVYLSHLRRKLEEDPRQPKYLVTEHGVGYRFQPPGN